MIKSNRINKNLKRVNIVFMVMLCFFVLSSCKKNEIKIDGNWQGELTIEMSHDHEEYQTWEERIVDALGNVEIIEHIELIIWEFTNTVVIKFGFDLETPIYNSQIEGNGTGVQSVLFSAPTQCSIVNSTDENFDISIFGSVQSTYFDLNIVPKVIPQMKIELECNKNVQVLLPDYKTYITGILSNIDLRVPIGDMMSTGGSGTINVSGSISPLTYIYSLKLNRN